MVRPAGNLYVQVVVKEHNIFKRDGADLYAVKSPLALLMPL